LICNIYSRHLYLKKLDQIDDDEDIQDWEEFVKEMKTTFSDKSKATDAK